MVIGFRIDDGSANKPKATQLTSSLLRNTEPTLPRNAPPPVKTPPFNPAADALKIPTGRIPSAPAPKSSGGNDVIYTLPFSKNNVIGGGAPVAEVKKDPWVAEEDGWYNSQINALDAALKAYEDDDAAERSRYETNYGESLKSLGWLTEDDPDTPDYDERETWNFRDQSTAAGRSATSLSDDYAGRGMLRSSAYDTAVQNLLRSLSDQLEGVTNEKISFGEDRDRQKSAFASQNTLSRDQAMQEAISRYENSLIR